MNTQKIIRRREFERNFRKYWLMLAENEDLEILVEGRDSQTLIVKVSDKSGYF